MGRLLGILVIAGVGFGGVVAGQAATIDGSVTDGGTGKGLVGAVVQVEAGGRLLRGATTDERGVFRLQGVAASAVTMGHPPEDP